MHPASYKAYIILCYSIFLIVVTRQHYNSSRISLPQHQWHYESDNPLLWEVVLCIVRYLATSLASAHQMSVANSPSPSCDKLKYLQTLQSVLWRAKSLWLRIADLLQCLRPWWSSHVELWFKTWIYPLLIVCVILGLIFI